MSSVVRSLQSSIGKKFLMGLTGLGLAGFVFAHMAGNLLVFVGAEAYNTYGHKLITNPLIYVAEVALLLMVLIHVYCAVQLTIENRRASGGSRYLASGTCKKRGSLASRTMIFSGSILLFFIVSHLISFKFGTYYSVMYNGTEMRDLHRLMIEVFQNPLYVVGYIVSLILLGVHLSHGVSSCFQSLGISHPRYTPAIKCVGWIYSLVVTAGFIAQPVYIFLFLRS